MLPDQRAGFRVERQHVVVAGGHIHHPILDDGCPFEGIFRAEAGAEMDGPGRLQLLHVGGGDLLQGRIARIVPIAADRPPFRSCGLAEIRAALGRRADNAD